jgi:phage FluMu gp28-like protein
MSFQMRGDCYMGVDIGRKKDRTVIWLVERLGDVAWTRKVEVLERTPFHAQFALIDSLMPLARRACIDATGLGMQLAEDLQRKWGTKVEPVTFNLENKEKMATLTKRGFEERKVRIPAAAFIRRSLNAVKRYTSPTGHFRFDAARTDQGHADEFWALALALSAASGSAVSTEFVASSAVQAHAASAAYM